MNNRNNMVPVCVRGLGLVTCCLCVKRLFEISIVSCRVCSITAIGWKRFASLNDKVLSFQNKGKSFSPFHTVKSHSPTLDITKLLVEKSKLRSKYHGNFEEKSGLWRVKKIENQLSLGQSCANGGRQSMNVPPTYLVLARQRWFSSWVAAGISCYLDLTWMSACRIFDGTYSKCILKPKSLRSSGHPVKNCLTCLN